ncbi:transporter substrate-binding domain-containing protein [Thalassospira alkalitolerans]|uniref:transporter substrate-binding domain-containing protein n=1 Tax=Thalassospira alkalitolerans TaxID=1293890 RepID=UPI0030ED5049|tara:strand:+ start:15994 stop:16914 length:921 start_codon:yes stop_codon:yes gene_type:complete
MGLRNNFRPIRAAITAMVGLIALPFMDRTVTANEQTTVTWAVPPLVPAFISENGVLTGYGAATQNWFISQLGDYNHETMEVPLARLLAEMRSGGDDIRCCSTLIPTDERREYISFANTVLLHLPISVVIRSADEAKFKPFLDEEGNIHLDTLMADDALNTAIRIGRSYGKLIDHYIRRFRDAPHITTVADDAKLLKLLELNRIDWAFYFPSEAEYFRRSLTPDQQIKSIPIAGNPPLLEATIGCARTPAGTQAIEKINQVIANNPDMPWTEFYAAWLSPDDRNWFRAARTHYINANQFEVLLAPEH